MKQIQRVIFLLLLFSLLFVPSSTLASSDKSIVRIGNDITIEKGQKVRRAITINGQITVNGTVEDSVLAIGGSVVLTKTAVVKGDVASLGGVIVMAKDAKVKGDLTEINSTNFYETVVNAVSNEWEGWSWVFALISLSILTVILVLALIISALMPKPVRIISEVISKNTFRVILVGILCLVTIVPLALLLTISVVGIALIPLEVILVVITGLLGFIAVSRLIGSWALRLGKRKAGIVRETFWGLVIIWMVGWIPYVGWMIKAIAIVIGLGAALITRFGTYQATGDLPRE
jgi:hypothetical protein